MQKAAWGLEEGADREMALVRPQARKHTAVTADESLAPLET